MPDKNELYFCPRCARYLQRSWFVADNTRNQGRSRHCRDCKASYHETRKAAVDDRYHRWAELYKLKTGCQHCGFMSTEPTVFHFDHIEAGDRWGKFGGFSSMKGWFFAKGGKLTWAMFQSELAKCQVLCANCHAIKTAADRREHGDEWVARRNKRPSPIDQRSLFD